MCLSHLIYTVRPCLIHTMPCPCHARLHAVRLKVTAQHVRREAAYGLPAHVRLFPSTTRSSAKVVIRSIPTSDAGVQCETKQSMSWTRKRVVAANYKKEDLLNCWTSSSDISGCHASFSEGSISAEVKYLESGRRYKEFMGDCLGASASGKTGIGRQMAGH